jgi:cell division protein ZipA
LAELRWILLGLGILAIGATWWWTARRSGQAPGNAELRESTAAPLHTFGAAAGDAAQSVKRSAHAETREWGVPPLVPLNIRTAERERVPELDQPMTAHTDPLDFSIDLGNEIEAAATSLTDTIPSVPASGAPPPPRPAPASSPAANLKLRPSAENGDRLAAVETPAPNASELQKIVTIRVCAVGDARWSGAALMAALEVHGLAYGRYQVYHRKHSDGRSIFCVASLIEPGTFDMAHMAESEFRGVTLFAVLPGPMEPLPAVDALLATARELARELSGMLQDTKGVPFSPQHALALREDVARFQAQLS